MIVWMLASAVVHAAPTAADLDRADALVEEANAFTENGEYGKAQGRLQESIEIRRKRLGPGHPEVASALANLGSVLNQAGDYAGALPLLEESLALRRLALDPLDIRIGYSLNNLAALLQTMGNNDAASDLYRQTLEFLRQQPEPQPIDIATVLNNLASIRQVLGDYDAALPLFEESLAILREVHGPGHPAVAAGLRNMATLLKDRGDYDAASALLEESLDIRRAVLDPEDRTLAATVNSLASLRRAQGDYWSARTLFEEGVAIWKKALGPRHPAVATGLNNLALTMRRQGDLIAARPLFEESRAIWEETLGPNHPYVAESLNNQAALLRRQGDLAGAREMFARSLEIRREAFGPRHPRVAIALNNLATLEVASGNAALALAHHHESLEITREVHGPRHPVVAAALHNLADTLLELDDPRARETAVDALEMRRDLLGDHHPQVGGTALLLASILRSEGDLDQALPLVEEGIEILSVAHGAHHTRVGNAISRLASIREARGELDLARPLRTEALHIVEGGLQRLDGLSEREALLYLPNARTTLDRWLAAFDRPLDADAAWTHTLLFKGIIAARAEANQALANVEPEVEEVARALAHTRAELARFAFGETDGQERASTLRSLLAEQEHLERELISKSASFRSVSNTPQATPTTLCEALPEGGVLIDLLRYRDGIPRYLAFVQNKSDCIVHRIELGPAKKLERAAVAWGEVVRDPASLPTRLQQRGEIITSLLWEPLEAVAGDSEHWVVVPDGPLATVSFAGLPIGEGRYAIEDHLITYLDRASVVLSPSPTERGLGAVVIGGVDYDAATSSSSETRSFLAPCNGGDFVALPGTALETEQLSSRWTRNRRRGPLTRLDGSSATESSAAAAFEGKSLAHIATHGFFATGDCKSAVDDGVGYDPMLLSGLVFAGANRPADPASPTDGILTAAEVATQDLSRTNLVVLSACETGLGEIESGQGVLGLRRAFAIAGARTLVMSLWAVPDDETAVLMDAMYRRYLRRRSIPAAEALRAAQLEVLARQRTHGEDHPFAWAAFIASGVP